MQAAIEEIRLEVGKELEGLMLELEGRQLLAAGGIVAEAEKAGLFNQEALERLLSQILGDGVQDIGTGK